MQVLYSLSFGLGKRKHNANILRADYGMPILFIIDVTLIFFVSFLQVLLLFISWMSVMLRMPFVALIIGHLVMTGVGCQWSGLGYTVITSHVFVIYISMFTKLAIFS